jgi:hypothetical protein
VQQNASREVLNFSNTARRSFHNTSAAFVLAVNNSPGLDQSATGIRVREPQLHHRQTSSSPKHHNTTSSTNCLMENQSAYVAFLPYSLPYPRSKTSPLCVAGSVQVPGFWAKFEQSTHTLEKVKSQEEVYPTMWQTLNSNGRWRKRCCGCAILWNLGWAISSHSVQHILMQLRQSRLGQSTQKVSSAHSLMLEAS